MAGELMFPISGRNGNGQPTCEQWPGLLMKDVLLTVCNWEVLYEN